MSTCAFTQAECTVASRIGPTVDKVQAQDQAEGKR